MENKEKTKVRILFRGGNSILLEVGKFSITKSASGKITEASWVDANPSIMYISLSDIEGVFEEK